MNRLFGLHGQVAVVTGALGTLGVVWCRTLLDAGASVFALDRPDAPRSNGFDDLQSQFGEFRLALARANVTDRAALVSASERCLAQYGAPTVLVNNAGIDRPPAVSDRAHRFEDVPAEESREILEVNALGVLLVCQVFGIHMVRAGAGSIVNIASLYAGVSPDARFYSHLRTDPPFLKPPAYGASKAAVVNLTRYLATLWAAHGVRVNALSPGGVSGQQDDEFRRKFCDRVPLGRMADADDLVGPLLFLASRASAYVTGAELVVDGGFTAW